MRNTTVEIEDLFKTKDTKDTNVHEGSTMNPRTAGSESFEPGTPVSRLLRVEGC
jgi:hypothetical protein